MKKRWVIFVSVLAVILLAVGVHLHGIFREFRRIREMPIRHIDPATVTDGTYTGQFAYVNQRIVVVVTVAEQKITQAILHESSIIEEYGKKALPVLERVVAKQSPQVDTVSGATTTSKALLKATEHALSPSKTTP